MPDVFVDLVRSAHSEWRLDWLGCNGHCTRAGRRAFPRNDRAPCPRMLLRPREPREVLQLRELV